MTKMTGYIPVTTFWSDFTIADRFGSKAVKETFNRAFNEWKTNYIYLTELVMILNWKSWEHHEENGSLSELYTELFEKADQYAIENLKDDELTYFLQTTD